MAKKIIKARLKQRTDTQANWAANNPVLLEGELGLVTDDKNLYKVGDGVTAWNDLPFRGFDGTLVHETGDSDSAAMSQRGVTQALDELKERMVEKVPGKGLSTEDYTTEEKEKLAELSEAVGKKSEVSLETLANGNLKVTINGESKDFMPATPSGDPMHYNYIVVGAEYNDTNAPIAKTDYYGNAVSHLPGRWYVEGLGDVTNAEMREIYEAGKWWEQTTDSGFCSQTRARAILRSPAYEVVTYKGDFNFAQAFNSCKVLETINLAPNPVLLAEPSFNLVRVKEFDFGCQGSPNIRYIYGIINASGALNDNSFWIHTAGLIEVRLYNIKRAVKLPLSKNISKASILYMIENEAATNALAITLHADAYARLSADADIVAALAAHPKVSLAKA